jgi:hypothetical protein
MADQDFRQLERDLEQALANLKATNDPHLRRELLLEMRQLLLKADGLLLRRPGQLPGRA